MTTLSNSSDFSTHFSALLNQHQGPITVLVLDDDPGQHTAYQTFFEKVGATLQRELINRNPEPGRVATKIWLSVETSNRFLSGQGNQGFDVVFLAESIFRHPQLFNIIHAIRQQTPAWRVGLLGQKDLNYCVKLGLQFGIFNIFQASDFLKQDFVYIQDWTRNLLHFVNPATAFGLRNYLHPSTQIISQVITSSPDMVKSFERIQHFITEAQVPNPEHFGTAVLEAMTNALYHGPQNAQGETKYDKGETIDQLSPNEYVQISYAQFEEGIGISVQDQCGRLTPQNYFYWLERNLSGNGILDESGRGLYLMHALTDEFILNIEPGRRTEFLLFKHYYQPKTEGIKPVYVNLLQ